STYPVLLTTPPPLTPTLFPYTTLFRSGHGQQRAEHRLGHGLHDRLAGVPADARDLGRLTAGQRIEARVAPRSVDRPAQPPRHRRSEEHTSELQSRFDLVCRLLLEKKKK